MASANADAGESSRHRTGTVLPHGLMQRLILLVAALTVLPSLMATQRPVNRAFATRSETIAPNALACTSHPLATQAA